MKISYRQMSILVFMSFISLKLLALPSLLYVEAKNMGWFVALVLMIIDGIYAFLIIDLIKKNQNKNVYEFMKQTVGTFFAKLFLILLGVRFLIIVANISKGLEFFVVENFYTEFKWLIYIIPLVILISFMVYKGIRNIARVSELMYVPITIGVLYIAFKSISHVDALTFLPLFKEGFQPILNAGYHHTCWFGSSTFLIMLFGRVDFKNERKRKLIFYVILAILVIQLMCFVFYGLYESTSPTHTYAISDISQFISERSSIDAFSWLIGSFWIVGQVIQIAIYGYCFVACFKSVFNVKSQNLAVFVLCVALIGWSYLGEKTINLESIFFTDWLNILMITTQYLIPLVLFIVYLIKNKKKVVKYEKNKNIIHAS
jgi:spore germination protein (amino acid permease)